MTESSSPPGAVSETIAALRRLPDLRAAIEALILFLMVMIAGVWAVQSGVIQLSPMGRGERTTLWLSVFFFPVLVEELAFRGWLQRGAARAAILSFLAYVAWFPLQKLLNLPFARAEFTDPAFLILVACLGFACTMTRVRSGSIWPGVVIHWGAVVALLALTGGHGAGPVQSP